MCTLLPWVQALASLVIWQLLFHKFPTTSHTHTHAHAQTYLTQTQSTRICVQVQMCLTDGANSPHCIKQLNKHNTHVRRGREGWLANAARRAGASIEHSISYSHSTIAIQLKIDRFMNGYCSFCLHLNFMHANNCSFSGRARSGTGGLRTRVNIAYSWERNSGRLSRAAH